MTEAVRDADATGQPSGLELGLSGRAPGKQQRQGDIFGDVQRGEEIEELKDKADSLPAQAREPVFLQVRDVYPAYLHSPMRRPWEMGLRRNR